MNAKKLLVLLFTALFVCVLHAQKPTTVLVWGEPIDNDAENRISSLIWEYYKSELATHSGLKLISAENIAKAQEKLKYIKPGTPDAAAIKNFCKETGAAVFCSVSLRRLAPNKFQAVIKAYKSNGVLIQTITHDFKSIKESDLTSVQTARKTAIAIRGESAVDVINLEREKRLQDELSDAEKAEKAKQNPAKAL